MARSNRFSDFAAFLRTAKAATTNLTAINPDLFADLRHKRVVVSSKMRSSGKNIFF